MEETAQVYTRDVYANKDFWNDRFAEQNGFFDWYAQWQEIKPVFTQNFQQQDSSILMVGCGNSKLSEEMSNDGYRVITNIDIAGSVIEKMKNHYSIRYPLQQFLVVDATNMAYRDNSFDLCIDKGTFDALACGSDPQILLSLVKEMMRVCREATVIVTSGGPEKRMPVFEQVCKQISYQKLEVSKLASLINILRTSMGNQPLSNVMKDPALLKEAMEELAAIERIKRLEIESQTDKKKKLALLLYKAKRKIDLESRAKVDNGGNALFNPQRQDFVMVYILRK